MGKTVTTLVKIAVFATLAIASGGISNFLAVGFLTPSVIAGIGVAGALSGITSLITPRPSFNLDRQQGQNLQLIIDPAGTRKIIYGTAATSGSLVYREAYGKNNKFLSLVIALAGHEVDGFEKLIFGSVEIPFTGNDAAAESKLEGVFQRFTLTGTDTQLAEPNLVADSVKWTDSHRLRSVAYMHVKLTYDADKYKQGLQNIVQIIRGRKIYDPRKDITNGGSGTHRREEPDTWEFSNNSALCIVDYLRGIRVNNTPGFYDGKLIAGMGIVESRIDWPNIIAEANICDELIPLKAAGFDSGFDTGFDAIFLKSQKRYTCDGIFDPGDGDHRQNLDMLATSMAGTVVNQSGKWRLYTGAPRAAIKSRTTDDVLGSVNYNVQTSISQKSNGVRGSFASADEDYNLRDYTPLQPAAFLADDGGHEAWLNLDLPFTTDAVRAQRISKIFLSRSRFQKRLDLSFNAIGLQDQVMDTVNFTYAPFNISSKKFLISEWALKLIRDEQGNTGFIVAETLIEEDDSIYGWQPSVDELPVFSVATSVKNEKHNDQRNLPVLNVSGAVVSTDPLSQVFMTASETGGVATINIAGHELITGFGRIGAGAGSVTGLLVGTVYYVYANDPLFEGGAISYIATTKISELSLDNNRRFVGSITTPELAAPPSTGQSGGGVSGGTGQSGGQIEV